MKAWVIALVVVVLVAVGVVAYLYLHTVPSANVYVYIGDKPMQVQALYVTINSIMFHNTNGEWVTCSNASIKLNLASLVNTSTLVANCKLPNGTYNLVFLYVSSAQATVNGKTYSCKVPSGFIKVPLEPQPMVINGTSSYNVNVDMGAVNNVNITGNGECIVKPVVRASVSRR